MHGRISMLMQPGPNATKTPKCLWEMQTEALCHIRGPLFDYCHQGILQYSTLLIFCVSICWLRCIGIGALTVSYFCQSDDGPLQVSSHDTASEQDAAFTLGVFQC